MTSKPDWADKIVALLPYEYTSATSATIDATIAVELRKAKADGLRLAADKCLDVMTENPYQLSLVLRALADETEKNEQQKT